MLFLVSVKISARKARGGDGWAEGEGEGGSSSPGVLAREMAAARARLAGGMGGIYIRGQTRRVRRGVVSRKQRGECL